MRYLALCLLAACGPLEPEPAPPGMAQVDAPITAAAPAKTPLLVTWGMTMDEVVAMAGEPDWTRAPQPSDPNYAGSYAKYLESLKYVDMYWAYSLPCGDWYVQFKAGIVTARFGLAGGCNPP